MELKPSSPISFSHQKPLKPEKSPKSKPSPILTSLNQNTLDPSSLSPLHDYSTKSLSCLNSQNQSSICEDLNNMELQIKDINHKLKSNISVLEHKQERTKELEFKLIELQEKEMNTEVSLEQTEAKCVICQLSCISF